jgi:nitronate monooxygenase
MAGGPSTPALTAAVSRAGGFGFVAAGYLSADGLRDAIAATRVVTSVPFGVNLFVPSLPGDARAVAAYAERLRAEAERLGATLGAPRWEDDAYEAKLEVVAASDVSMVSFTFGCPDDETVDRLHRRGIQVAVTVTSTVEAGLAANVGADLLIAQGTEAGGHQGSFADLAPNRIPLLSLLTEIEAANDLPVIASGGVMCGDDIAAALAAGAIAVQVGTALLCATESGTSATYQRALLTAEYPDTIVTRAFSGRYARGLANRFALEHDAYAPQAYPEVHHLTRPLRVAATAAGDSSVPNLWAGTGWRQLTAAPAEEIIRRLAAEAQQHHA